MPIVAPSVIAVNRGLNKCRNLFPDKYLNYWFTFNKHLFEFERRGTLQRLYEISKSERELKEKLISQRPH